MSREPGEPPVVAVSKAIDRPAIAKRIQQMLDDLAGDGESIRWITIRRKGAAVRQVVYRGNVPANVDARIREALGTFRDEYEVSLVANWSKQSAYGTAGPHRVPDDH